MPESAVVQWWLSYGAGINSTALGVLLCEGRLPHYEPWRCLFADTLTERPETYAYILDHWVPYLARFGKVLEIAYPKEGVLERWERLRVTGSRIIRSCTDEGKIKPMERYLESHGGGDFLLGIDASEAHRQVGKIRPLVDLDIDRDECERIIRRAGLPVPIKSGCWCCPFMRISEIVELAKTDPCRFERIKRLEQIATESHGLQPNGQPRKQWGDYSALEYEERAKQGNFWVSDRAQDLPCGCYDGTDRETDAYVLHPVMSEGGHA